MTGVFKFNPAILSSWRTTLQVFFQQLRKVAFVVENTFSFGDFDPQIDWNGMTVTDVIIYRARYLKIWKLLFLSIDLKGTLAAPLADKYYLTLPPGNIIAGDRTVLQLIVSVSNTNNGEIGLIKLFGEQNKMECYRPLYAAYVAGAMRMRAQGFIEVA